MARKEQAAHGFQESTVGSVCSAPLPRRTPSTPFRVTPGALSEPASTRTGPPGHGLRPSQAYRPVPWVHRLAKFMQEQAP